MRRWIIGIDEVGRGALAGPVTVGAFALKVGNTWKNAPAPLRDSKQLTPEQRRAWVRFLTKEKERGYIAYAVAHVVPSVIDATNISRAANRAATRAYTKLISSGFINTHAVFLDGGLYLEGTLRKKGLTAPKADERVPAVSLASIVAKVARDKLMERLHKKYPRYGFKKHKGYGTLLHRRAIARHGVSAIHRKTFLKN